MFIIAAALALADKPLDPPDDTQIDCLDTKAEVRPMPGVDLATLKAAYKRRLGFDASFKPDSDASGLLTFRGGRLNAETVIYWVNTVEGGSLGLTTMRIRLHGVSENIQGDDMCARTYAIINAK